MLECFPFLSTTSKGPSWPVQSWACVDSVSAKLMHWRPPVTLCNAVSCTWPVLCPTFLHQATSMWMRGSWSFTPAWFWPSALWSSTLLCLAGNENDRKSRVAVWNNPFSSFPCVLFFLPRNLSAAPGIFCSLLGNRHPLALKEFGYSFLERIVKLRSQGRSFSRLSAKPK